MAATGKGSVPRMIGLILGLLGSLGVVVGSFLSWAELAGVKVKGGLDTSDGKFTLGAGIVLLAFTVLSGRPGKKRWPSKILLLLLSLTVLVIGTTDSGDLKDIGFDTGIGLSLVIVAAFVLVLAGILLLIAKGVGMSAATDPVFPAFTPQAVPAAPSSPGSSPAGWYPDPSGSGRQRYYDGSVWTEHYG